jgi:hypothetical protein
MPGVDGVEHTSALIFGLTVGVVDYNVITRFGIRNYSSIRALRGRLTRSLRVASFEATRSGGFRGTY